jgi:anti-sigma regulatory factor (Ser/Thr protein kinase)
VDAIATFAGDPKIEVRSAVPGWTHLRIKPALGLREKLRCYVREILNDLPAKLCDELSMAVDELLSNSIEHGCRQDESCPVDFKIIRTARLLVFQIKDAGGGFSVESVTHAAVNNPPEEPLRHTQLRDELGLRPGGFGIMLVQKIADELIYNELGNEVMLVKYLDDV